MIKYHLGCQRGHEFEAWFKSIADYDRQAKKKLVVCPSCGSHGVEKIPVAPAIGGKSKSSQGQDIETFRSGPDHDKARAIIGEMRRLKSELLKNSEYVGPKFAEEARKIHFGEAPERAVHGEATLADASKLLDDGVKVGLIPKLPEDQN